MLHENEDVISLKFRSLQQLFPSKFEPWSDTNDLHLKKEVRDISVTRGYVKPHLMLMLRKSPGFA